MPGQAWAAEQVVVGTVVNQISRWEVNEVDAQIRTYSLLRVDERVRGVPLDLVIVDQPGGVLDGCAQSVSGIPLLQPGETWLLFLLRERSLPDGQPIYYTTGGSPGLLRVETDSDRRRFATSNGQRLPLDVMLQNLRDALAAPPPTYVPAYTAIPLTQAPLAPTTTPRP